MGEIHELLVLALSLVWFARATSEKLHDNTILRILLSEYLLSFGRLLYPKNAPKTAL